MSNVGKTKKQLVDEIKALKRDLVKDEDRISTLLAEHEMLRNTAHEVRKDRNQLEAQSRELQATIKTLQYMLSYEKKMSDQFQRSLRDFIKLYETVSVESTKKDRVIDKFAETAEALSICPKCGAMKPSEEMELRLCAKCASL